MEPWTQGLQKGWKWVWLVDAHSQAPMLHILIFPRAADPAVQTVDRQPLL
jgi:hypothetical protein